MGDLWSNLRKVPQPFAVILIGALFVVLGASNTLDIKAIGSASVNEKFRWTLVVCGFVLMVFGLILLSLTSKSEPVHTQSNSYKIPEDLKKTSEEKLATLSDGQKSLLRVIWSLDRPGQWISEESIRRQFDNPKDIAKELYYRLEHLRFLGFIDKHEYGKNAQGYALNSYKVTAEYLSEELMSSGKDTR